MSQRSPRRRAIPAGPAAALARAVRERRLALGLTQLQLADLSGVSRDTVMELESGRGGVSVGTGAAVATALGLELTVRRTGQARDER